MSPRRFLFVALIDTQRSRARAVARTALFAFVRGSATAAGTVAVSALVWLLRQLIVG
jgi:hypothetical protein